MSKHTPGPWVYENYGGTVHVFLDNEYGTPSICKLLSFDKNANARLIAAAPELLEALERVKATGVFLGAITQEMVDAAIAKAKGE